MKKQEIINLIFELTEKEQEKSAKELKGGNFKEAIKCIYASEVLNKLNKILISRKDG
jgi:hypothetical protein